MQKELKKIKGKKSLDIRINSKRRGYFTMNEKMKEALKNIYDNLTDEQKEKAKACKTNEELMDFAGKEGIELPDDLVESVSGGLGLLHHHPDGEC